MGPVHTDTGTIILFFPCSEEEIQKEKCVPSPNIYAFILCICQKRQNKSCYNAFFAMRICFLTEKERKRSTLQSLDGMAMELCMHLASAHCICYCLCSINLSKQKDWTELDRGNIVIKNSIDIFPSCLPDEINGRTHTFYISLSPQPFNETFALFCKTFVLWCCV